MKKGVVSDRTSVYINYKNTAFSQVFRKGVFHIIHRVFHRQTCKNPLQTEGLQGVNGEKTVFCTFLWKKFLVYRTTEKTQLKLYKSGKHSFLLAGIILLGTVGLHAQKTFLRQTPIQSDLLALFGFSQINPNQPSSTTHCIIQNLFFAISPSK